MRETSSILFTLAEDEPKTSDNHFAVRYSVDENDCYDFADGLKALGHKVYFANWKDLAGDRFTRLFCDNEKQFVSPLAVSSFDLAFVYKMEGFLFDVPRFERMVSLFERNCGVVVNHPQTIRHNIDKRYLWDLEERGVAVPKTLLVGEAVRMRLRRGEKMVLKPRCAERGFGALLATDESALQSIAGKEDYYIAQEYLPSIRDGERSLAYLGNKFQHAVIKKPSPSNPDEFRCNESLGGTVEVYNPTDSELHFAQRVLDVYASLGCEVHFSRVDLVIEDDGPVLIEAELLNPSIYANYSNRGKEFGATIAQYFHNLIERHSLTRRSR
jgi:glutathione synthase/RimK-type ligase-like ATP-grasp enzyme